MPFEPDSSDEDSTWDGGAQVTADPQDTAAEQWIIEKEYLTDQLDLAEKKNREHSSELWRLTVKVRGLNGKIRSMDAHRQALLQDRLTLRADTAELQALNSSTAKELERVLAVLEEEKKESFSLRLQLACLGGERDGLASRLCAAREAGIEAVEGLDQLSPRAMRTRLNEAGEANSALRSEVTTLRARILALEKINCDHERANESLRQLQSEANLRVAAFSGIFQRTIETPPPQDESSGARTPLSLQQAPRQSSPVTTTPLPFYCYSTQSEDSLQDQLLASGEPATLSKINATPNDHPLPLDSPTAKRVRTRRWASAQAPTI
ncbi:hypothetical protein CF319_g5426 [Tilletia indica]|nr:hypothetical protein CF319_g5426 [Tilletia indica]KAE8233992.1 hypothetical protein CF326_g968 [Tilletia indica]